ncbi:MAG TPA: hypothetical protein VMV10_03665 [Pirellulales bacterium]|nr:hypothetical protein [Pirellulales bacterium]
MFRTTPPAIAVILIVGGLLTTFGAEALAAERAQASNPSAAASQPATRVIRRYRSTPVDSGRTVSESQAQALVNAPTSRNYVPVEFLSRYQEPRNYGPTDVGGRGTATGRGISQVPDEPFTNTTLYGGYDRYFSPMGYGGGVGTGGLYGFGNGWGNGAFGSPYGLGWGMYGSRYFPPSWYYPGRTSLSVYNPYFYYGNSYYGGYSGSAWAGFGRFGFPYSATAVGGFGNPYAYGGFGYPYAYGVYGYPYYGYLRPTQLNLPTYSFMYPGAGGLYVPPGYFGFPGYYGYGGYGMPLGSYGYGGAFYW